MSRVGSVEIENLNLRVIFWNIPLIFSPTYLFVFLVKWQDAFVVCWNCRRVFFFYWHSLDYSCIKVLQSRMIMLKYNSSFTTIGCQIQIMLWTKYIFASSGLDFLTKYCCLWMQCCLAAHYQISHFGASHRHVNTPPSHKKTYFLCNGCKKISIHLTIAIFSFMILML